MEEFIWDVDYYAYHITGKDNIPSIKNKGLVPMIGNRSILVGDQIKAIYFFDNLSLLYDWMNALYCEQDKNSLEVLRFNLKNIKWYNHNDGYEDWYVTNSISPNNLEYLNLFDNNNNIVSYNNLFNHYYTNDLNYKWKSLKKYNK